MEYFDKMNLFSLSLSIVELPLILSWRSLQTTSSPESAACILSNPSLDPIPQLRYSGISAPIHPQSILLFRNSHLIPTSVSSSLNPHLQMLSFPESSPLSLSIRGVSPPFHRSSCRLCLRGHFLLRALMLRGVLLRSH